MAEPLALTKFVEGIRSVDDRWHLHGAEPVWPVRGRIPITL